jgi:hypothetical protein
MSSVDLNTVFNGTNGFQSTFVGFNEGSNFILGDMLLAAIFIIIIFMLRNYEFRDSLMSSTTIVWIVSLLLWAGGLTDFTRVAVTFSILLVALLYTYVKD